MNTNESTVTRKKQKNDNVCLALHYLRRWYILILTVFTCFAGYAMEILMYNFFVMKNISHFVSAVLAIFAGGFISTFPFFVLSMYLAFKKKKYYALAAAIVALEAVGMAFFLYNQIILAGM